MIRKVQDKRDLKRFIYFVNHLYKDDPHYIYPLFYILYKELKEEVLNKKDYTAIISIDENNTVNGRLLYRMEYNPKEAKNICYFSYFDCINSYQIASELFDYMEAEMINQNFFYSEGSFTPYDPDNRRGILVKGFDSDPVIFTSYNKEYIPKLLEKYGYTKNRDTFSIKVKNQPEIMKKLTTFSKFFEKRYKIDVDYIDFNNIDKEINDIYKILLEADNEHIYQETPSVDLIRNVAINLRMFLDKRIVMIARESETKKPVGFFFCLLDFNQVFKKTRGKIKPLKLLFGKKSISKARGMMQYVIPEYQGTGLIGYIYEKIYKEFLIMGIKEFEAGTIMEGNSKALTTFSKFGGEIANIYRIYGKEINR